MDEKKIEKIQVIVKEHLDKDGLVKSVAKAHGVEPYGATVGIKIAINGELFGTYTSFMQPTLSVAEVVESINEQFESLLKEVRKNG